MGKFGGLWGMLHSKSSELPTPKELGCLLYNKGLDAFQGSGAKIPCLAPRFTELNHPILLNI
jgi:hypothetical protein